MKRIEGWYWNHGRHRQGKYEMGLDWLDSVSTIIERWEAMKKAHEQGSKGCVALWGPSQSGKSTLISRYIDGDDDGDGSKSALTWPGGTNARFCPKDENARRLYPNTVILNPYRFGSDASGVATKYVLKEDYEVVDKEHPVEIILASRAQILYALAAGYLYECDTRLETGMEVFWDRPNLDDFISRLNVQNTQGAHGDDGTFKILRDLFQVVESMLSVGERRYSNLGGDWEKSLRKRILLETKLNTSRANADAFTHKLLWDSKDSLNRLFSSLDKKRADLAHAWADTKIFCSLELASLILDIGSFKDFKSDDNEPQKQIIRDKIRSIRWREDDGKILIDCGQNGKGDLSGDTFGLFQALVGELIVPIMKDSIDASKVKFLNFMSKNDLLDFPGVPQQDQAAKEAMLDLSQIKQDDPILLTRLFKRGKTLSMVASKSKDISVDSFLILCRSDRPVSKPQIISSGIDQWLKCFDKDFRGLQPNAQMPLPIHINLTFFSVILNNAHQAGVANLDEVAKRLDDLGVLSSARSNAKFHLTTYKHLPDGQLGNWSSDESNCSALRQNIVGNETFIRRLPDIENSLKSVIEADDGGTETMFDRLSGIDSKTRFQLYRKTIESDKASLEALIRDNLPGPVDAQAQAITKIVADVENSIRAVLGRNDIKTLRRLGEGIRELSSISLDIFEPLPLPDALQDNPNAFMDYVLRHLEKWSAEKMKSSEAFFREHFGLDNQSKLRTFMDALVSSADTDTLAQEIDTMATSLEIPLQDLRIPLTYAFSNSILHGGMFRSDTHRANHTEILTALGRNHETHPFYLMIVSPFLVRLEKAKNAQPQQRGKQKGDDELQGHLQIEFYGFVQN